MPSRKLFRLRCRHAFLAFEGRENLRRPLFAQLLSEHSTRLLGVLYVERDVTAERGATIHARNEPVQLTIDAESANRHLASAFERGEKGSFGSRRDLRVPIVQPMHDRADR